MDNILEQKSLLRHLMIILLSLITTLLYSVFRNDFRFPEDQLYMFLLLIVQLELFISVAVAIFKGLKPGITKKEMTRTVLSHFVIFIVSCFLIAIILNLFFVAARSLIAGTDPGEAIGRFFTNNFGQWLKATISGLLFGAAIFIFIQWQDALKREQKLREENLIFQNETLKSQVNPHFLFNNLNTLSSLIISEPEAAETFISKLSSIYRYIIENYTKDRVPLAIELDFIRDYFHLYQIRDENKMSLDIKVNSVEGMFILPVSLQILVENAIKHNRATREEPLKIEVLIEGQDVVVKNNIQKMATQLKSTGTGLKNLASRIKLATGKEIYVGEAADSFIVKIPLMK